MNWLPKERQSPFIIVVLTTAGLLAAIYFGLIGSQSATLEGLKDKHKALTGTLERMKDGINNVGFVDNQLNDLTNELALAEQQMASGDLYSWTYGSFRRFNQKYNSVEIPEIGHPAVAEMDLIAAFPYKQVSFNIDGRAYFHDLGNFVADFENAFPHARLVNLSMEPASSEGEKLSFRMQVIELVKANE